MGRHWLKTKENLGVITIIKINYNKQTVIISVVSVRARSCMQGHLRESQSWILVWTSFPHWGSFLFILPHTKKSCCIHPLQSASQGGRFLQYQELNASQGPSPGDSGGSGIPTLLAAKRSGCAPSKCMCKSSSLPHLSPGLPGPSTWKSAACEIVLIQRRERKRKK